MCKGVETNIAGFANKVEPEQAAHHDPPHLDLQCLPCSLRNLIMIELRLFAGVNFAVCFLALKRLMVHP